MEKRYLLIAIIGVFGASMHGELTAPARADVASGDGTGAHDATRHPVAIGGIDYPDIEHFHGSVEFKTGGYRCGTAAPPASFAAVDDCDPNRTAILPGYDPTFDMEISVVFHAITNELGGGYVSEELIHSQMGILNEDFQALIDTPGGAGTNARIRFALATVDPDGEPTTGILRYADNDYFIDGFSTKRDLHWDTRRYLNVYSNNPGGVLGYATFPWDALGDEDDGVVVGWRYVGRDAPDGGEYDQGRTLTHEIGHYLGLLHTFHDGCGAPGQGYTSGDLIADTQAEFEEAYGCTPQESACGGGPKPIDNYMNYTDDACMSRFTPEQINRMRCSIWNYRVGHINDFPIADFLAESNGRTIRFVSRADDLDGEVVSWLWDLGDGATSTEESPTHTYEQYGEYAVTLTVTDDFGSSATATDTVLANDLPTADFGIDGDGLAVQFRDRSDDDNGPIVAWSWNFGDGTNADAASPKHVYSEPGTYPVQLTVTDSDGGQAATTVEVTVPLAGGCTIGTAPRERTGLWLVVLLLVATARGHRAAKLLGSAGPGGDERRHERVQVALGGPVLEEADEHQPGV